MSHAPTTEHETYPAPKPRSRRIRLSTMALLAAGALSAAQSAHAQVSITSAADLALLLNTDEDVTFLNDVVLTGSDFNVTRRTQFFGDGGTRTITGGTITVTGSTSETNYILFNLTPSVIYTGSVVLDEFSQLDIDAPSVLGAAGTVTGAANTGIRLFTGDGQTNTWDSTFFAKISGVADSTAFSVVGDGTSIMTALPTFNALIELNTYSDFDDFAANPDVDPTLQLGASLTGNHNVTVNVGTLDLNDFDFTIDSLSGATGSSVDLGSGTLTTGDATTTTYAGVISGTGNLVKTGTGIFTLSSINTYTGTTTVSDGTLRFTADQTGTTAVTIEDGGTLLVNSAQTGVPTYTVENGGTLTLNADLADTTPITIDAGGLLELNGRDQTFASLAGGGDITLEDAALTFGDANSTTLSGVISGTGSLTKTGAGTLTLSGANTYSGATTLSEGTITLDGSLANTSGVTLANGTTLTLNGDINDAASVAIGTGSTLDLNANSEMLGSITGDGDVTLGGGTLTLGNSSSFTFDGTISEAGGIIKQNGGTLTFSGAQTYTGTTVISGGTLVANGDLATSGVTINDGATFALESTMTTGTADILVLPGGTLYGTGTIADDLNNAGTVTFVGPGSDDTLTVSGDYTQSAVGTLQIQIGDAGGLVVTGTATLDGTLDISLPANPATFDINATYDAVDAGALAGNFSTVTDSFVFLDLTSTNVGGNVEITLARNAVALTDVARTPNQTNVAAALDGVGAPTGNLESALNRILASSEAGARATYDQLAGASAATVSTEAAAAAANQSNRVLDQVTATTPGSTRPLRGSIQANATNRYKSDSDYAQDLTLFSFSQALPEEASEPTNSRFSELSPTPWASFYGGFGDQGDGAEGLDYTRYGLLAGLELKAAESDARYGLSFGFEQSDFDFNQSDGNTDITSIYFSGYTRQPLGDDFFFTATGTAGFHTHDAARYILIGVTPTQAKADFNSYSFSVAGELSKAFHFTKIPVDPGGHPTATSIEPFARLHYSISDQDGYSETGAGPAGLDVESGEFDSFRTAFGVRAKHQYMLFSRHEAVFEARGLVNIALSNSDSNLNVSFVNTPGSNFTIEGSDQDDVYGQIGVGLTVELNSKWDMHFDLDQQFSDSAMGTTVSGGVSYKF